MLELQTKVKRQIEIVGLAVDNPRAFKDIDFALLYKRDVPTIKRDMQELRALGIGIHSEKRRGICLAAPMDPQMVKELIHQYLGMCTTSGVVDKATNLLVRKFKDKALHHVVTLQRCIEASESVRIDYQKDGSTLEKDREINPLLIFGSDGYWRVLAAHDGRIKQYHLNKILGVKATGRKFKRVPPDDVRKMFRHSFRSWIGEEQHHIRIRLSKLWADRISPQQLMETEVITENADGSVVFESTVNSLEEVASWVVSRGEGVEVLEPAGLKEKVIALAEGALANYKTTRSR
jgi:predicted DNA-binding transcriptional regulator YafY